LVHSDSARLDTELLLCAAMAKSRTWLFTWPEKNVLPAQQQLFKQYFARRLTGEPVAYILGEKEFWSLTLQVNASTLIPRPETELLVELALELPCTKQTLLDLGTGTGAIALALASELPASKVIAVDSSHDAVCLAKGNAARLNITNIEVRQSDWFSALQPQFFDLILSNPPYINEADEHLSVGDVMFEPGSALVAAENGLSDIRHIISQAQQYLAAGAYLLIEHGWRQADAVQALFLQYGYCDIGTHKDWGGNDRVTLAAKPINNE